MFPSFLCMPTENDMFKVPLHVLNENLRMRCSLRRMSVHECESACVCNKKCKETKAINIHYILPTDGYAHCLILFNCKEPRRRRSREKKTMWHLTFYDLFDETFNHSRKKRNVSISTQMSGNKTQTV